MKYLYELVTNKYFVQSLTVLFENMRTHAYKFSTENFSECMTFVCMCERIQDSETNKN